MLHLRLLGEPLLTDPSGKPLSLWRPEMALVGLVACSGRQVRREAAAALLWPESPEGRARGALRQTLFRLRKRAGEVVRVRGEGLALDSARVSVDVLEMERSLEKGHPARAVELYEGPFLKGFFLTGNAEFDRWADARRARFREELEKALHALLLRAEEAGEWRPALEWAERLADLSPFAVDGVFRLARLRALSGDRDGALRALEELGARLRDELEVKPPPEVAALAERIRAGAGPKLETPRSPGRREASPEPWPMLGRGEEFRRLGLRWAETREGRHRLVLLTGEPGIGKTRLAHEFVRRARLEGGTVLEGRAYGVERGVPYAALAGILADAVHAPGLSALDGSALVELSRVAPSLAQRFSGGLEHPTTDLAAGRFRLMHAFHSLLENLAYEAPLLLLLDDLPWADEATVAVLHYAWRTLPGHPILYLATARSEELTPDEPGHRLWVTALRDEPDAVEEIGLGPLSVETVGRLAGPARDARDLRRRTGGNPLFLVELLRDGEEGAEGEAEDRPRKLGSLRVVVDERLRRLSEAEVQILQAAAILGRRFPLPTAAAIAGLDLRAGARAVGRLADKGLVREAGVAYDFVHDVVREIVREHIPTGERRLLHRAAFHRLSPEAAAEGESWTHGRRAPGPGRAGALARHAAEAGLAGEAFRWSLVAARQAEDVYAPTAAAGYLARARASARTPEELRLAWTRTGELEWARSRFPEAALAFLEALRLTEPGTGERLRLRIRLVEASLRGNLVEPGKLLDEMGPLLAEADGAGDPGLLRDARAVAAEVRLEVQDPEGAMEESRGAVTAAREAGAATSLVRTLLLQARMAHRAGARAAVLPALDEAVAVARQGGPVRELCDALSDRGTELSRVGRWDEALATWEEGIRRAVEGDEFGAEAVLRLNVSDILARRGDREAALRQLDRAEELCHRFHFPHVEAAIPVNRALAAWLAGDDATTVRYAAEALGGAEEPAGPRAADGRPFPAPERAARSLLLLALLAEGADREAIGEALTELAATDPTDHPTWADDREITALARARAREALGDARASLEALRTAREQVDDAFGLGLLLLEEARLLAHLEPQSARGSHLRAQELLSPLGLRVEPGRQGSSPTDTGGAGDRNRT